MKTLIKNGTILTTENEFVSDVLVEGEKIVAIGKDLPADGVDKVIDATGKMLTVEKIYPFSKKGGDIEASKKALEKLKTMKEG